MRRVAPRLHVYKTMLETTKNRREERAALLSPTFPHLHRDKDRGGVRCENISDYWQKDNNPEIPFHTEDMSSIRAPLPIQTMGTRCAVARCSTGFSSVKGEQGVRRSLIWSAATTTTGLLQNSAEAGPLAKAFAFTRKLSHRADQSAAL